MILGHCSFLILCIILQEGFDTALCDEKVNSSFGNSTAVQGQRRIFFFVGRKKVPTSSLHCAITKTSKFSTGVLKMIYFLSELES